MTLACRRCECFAWHGRFHQISSGDQWPHRREGGVQTLGGVLEAMACPKRSEGKKVLWYTCGPTVYDVAHMGHARAYLTFDILRRIMMDYLKFDVKYQRPGHKIACDSWRCERINITDIDDKIILRARQNKLFSDFSKEAASMSSSDLEKKVREALEKKATKLKAKTPEKPTDGNARAQQEYATLVEEHALKLKQHSELTSNVEEAIASNSSERVLSAAREVLMDALDKQLGHTVTDHSIFDQHGRHFEKDCVRYFKLLLHVKQIPLALEEYFEDMKALGILEPDVVTRITEYMDGRVQKFIEKLEDMGVAYDSSGSAPWSKLLQTLQSAKVYFDIAAFEKLGLWDNHVESHSLLRLPLQARQTRPEKM